MATRGARNKATSKPMEHTPKPAVDAAPSKPLRRRSVSAVEAEAAAAADHSAAVETCHIVIRKLSAGNAVVEEYDGVYDPERVRKHGVGAYQISLVRPTGTETIAHVIR